MSEQDTSTKPTSTYKEPSTLGQIIATLGAAVPGGSTALDLAGGLGVGEGSLRSQQKARDRERYRPITEPVADAAGKGVDFLTNTFLPGVGQLGGYLNQGYDAIRTPGWLSDALKPSNPGTINENPGVKLPEVDLGTPVDPNKPAPTTQPATAPAPAATPGSHLINQETGNVILPSQMTDKLATMNPEMAAAQEQKWRMAAGKALASGNGVGHLMNMGYSKEDALKLNDMWQKGGARHHRPGWAGTIDRAQDKFGMPTPAPAPAQQPAQQPANKPTLAQQQIDAAKKRPGGANNPGTVITPSDITNRSAAGGSSTIQLTDPTTGKPFRSGIRL